MLPFVMTRTVKVGAQENYLNGGCADVFDLNFCPSPPIDVKRTKPEQKPFSAPPQSQISTAGHVFERKKKVVTPTFSFCNKMARNFSNEKIEQEMNGK